MNRRRPLAGMASSARAPPCCVDVRAERAGNGNGRVYTIHYTVTDDANNTTDHTCSVGVPHSQNGSPAVDDGPQTTRQ